MTKKKRKRNNNNSNKRVSHNSKHKNRNSKNNKKSKTQKTEQELVKPRRDFVKKLGLGILVSSLCVTGGVLLYNSIKTEEKKLNYFHKEKEQTPYEIYKTWMNHYDTKGIDSDLLVEISPTTKKLMKKFESLNQEEVNKFLFVPYEKFTCSGRPLYKDFATDFIIPVCSGTVNEEWHIEAYSKILQNKEIKALSQIEKYINENYDELRKLNDDDFVFWALNSAYFAIRNSYSSGRIYGRKKDDLCKALDEKKGDCDTFSFLIRSLYVEIINFFDKASLCKKVSIEFGLLLDKEGKKSGPHAWLNFETYGKKQIIETNSKVDDKLILEEYNPANCYSASRPYIKGAYRNSFYIPIYSISTEVGRAGKSFKSIKKVHILPEEIEVEINQNLQD